MKNDLEFFLGYIYSSNRGKGVSHYRSAILVQNSTVEKYASGEAPQYCRMMRVGKATGQWSSKLHYALPSISIVEARSVHDAYDIQAAE